MSLSAHVCQRVSAGAPCPVPASPRARPQWSYGFYLIHLQGKQGFQLFCKTEDMKRKWMEQFEMAMCVLGDGCPGLGAGVGAGVSRAEMARCVLRYGGVQGQDDL